MPAPRPRPRTIVMAVAVIALSAGALPAAQARDAGPPPWLDHDAPVEQRVASLLDAMTLAEKVGQMDQQLADNLTDPDGTRCGANGFNDPNPQCLRTILVKNHVGSVLAGATTSPIDTTGQGGPGNTGRDWATQYNRIQEYAIRNTRLHLPVVFGIDAVHGFGHPYEAPLFPQSIGVGATWDTGVARAGGRVTADAVRATGWTWNFAPVQDIYRDQRWGRDYETWGEAPTLVSAMGAAAIEGLQEPSADGPAVAATVKHFAGYSQSVNGHDRAEALLPLSYLQTTILPGYAAGIDAGAATVMVNSGAVNGVPATGSHYLLTDILRGQLGFDGVTISDYQDVAALQTAYHVAPDLGGAIAIAVNAGVDMAMQVGDAAGFQKAILADVNNGAISEERIDEAVGRILTLKFRLGLFDLPCVADPDVACVDVDAADAAVTSGRDVTLDAARKSMTLLRNEGGVLPLDPASRVTVTGPSADSMTNQLGGWSVSWQGAFGSPHTCCAGPANQIPPGTTVQAGVLAADADARFEPDRDAALAAADVTDTYVVAVGETAYAEGLGDDPSPSLSPADQALIADLEATGKPVVVVVIAGRPLALGPAERAAGILMAYQGSTEAGQAVAEVLFGAMNPSGHLPVSWPSSAPAVGGDFDGGAPSPEGDQPKYVDLLPSTGSGPGNRYNPLYPFGFGLSYTTFTTTNLTVPRSVRRDAEVTATFTVTNTGSRAGTAVVPVYVAQEVSSNGRIQPPQRLVGFTRVDLEAGASAAVSVTFPTSVLAQSAGDIDASGPPVVSPGRYTVQINAGSTTPYDVAVSAPLRIR